MLLAAPYNNSTVLELPNRSLEPHTYRMNMSDMRIELEDWILDQPPEYRGMIIWHTHPDGGIGPSREDMQAKPPKATFLVVALTPEGPIPALF